MKAQDSKTRKWIEAPIDGCMYSSPEHPIICYPEKIEFNMSAVLCLLLPLIYSRYQEFQLVLDDPKRSSTILYEINLGLG